MNAGAFISLPTLDSDSVLLDTFNEMASSPGKKCVLRSTRTIHRTGLTSAEAVARRNVYGLNLIAVRVKPILVLLFREVSSPTTSRHRNRDFQVITPFYIFQVFSVCLWYSDQYVYYASVIVIMSVTSIVIDIYQTHTQEKAVRDMVHSSDVISVQRAGGGSGDQVCDQVQSTQLVPGECGRG
jgi:cation-transporting ATPase 13A3/4/5